MVVCVCVQDKQAHKGGVLHPAQPHKTATGRTHAVHLQHACSTLAGRMQYISSTLAGRMHCISSTLKCSHTKPSENNLNTELLSQCQALLLVSSTQPV